MHLNCSPLWSASQACSREHLEFEATYYGDRFVVIPVGSNTGSDQESVHTYKDIYIY